MMIFGGVGVGAGGPDGGGGSGQEKQRQGAKWDRAMGARRARWQGRKGMAGGRRARWQLLGVVKVAGDRSSRWGQPGARSGGKG